MLQQAMKFRLDDFEKEGKEDLPIQPIKVPFESNIKVAALPPTYEHIEQQLMKQEPLDVVAMAKVDVPTYTQRLIDDLKKHEDEYRKKELESFSKNAEVEAKDPFKADYTITKGALDPEIMPGEVALLSNRQEDIEKWQGRADLKERRSRERESLN